MKKTIFILICLICASYTTRANAAAAMCVKQNTTMVVLDPAVNGTAKSNSSVGKSWSTQFDYGVISGIGACYNNLCIATGCIATDQNVLSPYTTGGYCYCKMLRPVTSRWVYGSLADAHNCATNCASNCSSKVASTLALRRGLFGSIDF